jgi:FlaA1/EpsC-like NDP-sugar epimerase
MTIPEATQLVMQAGAMGGNGEVFLLDMGEPVKIIELAIKMVELSGLKVKDANNHGDIEIKITGLRPGEKLYEELLIGEQPIPTDHPEIFMGMEDFLPAQVMKSLIEELISICKEGNSQQASKLIHSVIRMNQTQELLDQFIVASGK